MSGEPLPRIFRALDGLELARVISQAVEDRLLKDPHFRRHMTYALVSFTFDVKVAAFPMQPPEFSVGAERETVETPEAAELPDDAPMDALRLTGGLNVDAPAEGGLTPDAARRAAGIPIVAPTRVSLGRNQHQIVDQELPNQPAPPPRPPMPEPVAHADGGEGSLTMPDPPGHRGKRSVDLGTRANPTGPRVDGNVLP